MNTSRNLPGFGGCKKVSIANCTLGSSSANIEIELEGAGTLRGIVVKGCTIRPTEQTQEFYQSRVAAIDLHDAAYK